MQITYPLDLSGVNPQSYVKDELHTVSEAKFKDYYFIVPKFAPFFIDNFKLYIKVGETKRLLTEDVDYSFALPYVTGTRTTGKQMYGAVTLNNLELNGILLMDYQTIGGEHVADRLTVLSYLADKAYNPRTTIWDIITDVPQALPPTPHYQDYDNFYGQEEVVRSLVDIRDAILSNSSLTAEKIREFLATYNNERGGFVLRAGDTMTGPLTLPGGPTEAQHAATKKYVDERIADTSNLMQLLSHYVRDEDFHFNMELKLDKTGGVMTGPIALHADPIEDNQPATKRYVDAAFNALAQNLQQLSIEVQQLIQNNSVSKQYVDERIDEISARFSTYK